MTVKRKASIFNDEKENDHAMTSEGRGWQGRASAVGGDGLIREHCGGKIRSARATGVLERRKKRRIVRGVDLSGGMVWELRKKNPEEGKGSHNPPNPAKNAIGIVPPKKGKGGGVKAVQLLFIGNVMIITKRRSPGKRGKRVHP